MVSQNTFGSECIFNSIRFTQTLTPLITLLVYQNSFNLTSNKEHSLIKTVMLKVLMGGEGFEPSWALSEPLDLQSSAFSHSATSPIIIYVVGVAGLEPAQTEAP